MGLDVVVLPRRRPVWLAPFDRARDGGESTFDEGADLAGERQHPRGDALQDGQRVGQVARPARRCARGFVRGAPQQRGQVVGQDLGGDVDQQRVLAESLRVFLAILVIGMQLANL